MNNEIGYLLTLNILILSVPGLFAWSCGEEEPYIFVDYINQVPEERKAYFFALLDYEKELVKGLTGYLEILYGEPLDRGYLEQFNETDPIKEEFFPQAEIIQNAGNNILIKDEFSQRDLYYYQRMIQRHTDTFNQIFH